MLQILHIKKKTIFIIGLFLLICFCCISTAVGSTISVSPQLSTAPVGDNFTIEILVDPTGSEIYGMQYKLKFNKNILEAIDQTKGTLLTQDGTDSIELINAIDNDVGELKYGETRIGDPNVVGGISDPGILTSITFKVIGIGASGLGLEAKISDPYAQSINVEINHGVYGTVDLQISDISVSHNLYNSAWEDLCNTVNVTLLNNDTDDTGNFNIILYADDKEVGTLYLFNLTGGASTVVSYDWTPTEAKTYNLTVFAVDAEATISQNVMHNGYTGDKPLTTYTHNTTTGDLYFSHGDSFYSGKIFPDNTYTVTHDVTLPDGATVEFARLYNYWTWSASGSTGKYPTMSLTFNDNAVDPDAKYDDRKGWSAIYDFPAGTWAYDVTSQVTGSGTYTTVVTNTDTDPKSFVCMDGVGLLIVYNDPNGQQIEYWINEGADMLSTMDTSGGMTAQEATTTSLFLGSVDLDNVESARLWTVVQSGGNDGNKLIFNAAEWTGVYVGTPYSDLDIDEARDVKDNLVASDNIAKIQAAPEATGGDYLMPSNAFLVLNIGGTPAPALSISANPITVTINDPTDVTFTVTSDSTSVEGAIITLTGCVDGSGTTDANGIAIISVNATSAGTITATASKDGYISADTALTAEKQGEGTSSSVSLSVNIKPAISFVVTPNNIDFGVLSPGETSNAQSLTLENKGGSSFTVTAQVSDNMAQDSLFKNGFLLDSAACGDYTISIAAQSSDDTNASLSVPGNYIGVGQKQGEIVFWAQA